MLRKILSQKRQTKIIFRAPRRATNFFRDRSAFSIIEIITVLFIVSFGLISILSLIVQNIKSQDYNKKTLMAYQLAQEGVELIRKVRDSNWRAQRSFNYNLASGTYYMDYRDDAPHLLPSEQLSLKNLGLDINGFYVHEPLSTASGFARSIIISNIDTYILQIYSDVFWTENGQLNSYRITTSLYDWY